MEEHTTREQPSIPEPYPRRKLNALYREIPLSDTQFRLLRKYFNAMANLYGIIPLWKAFEIIQAQNPGRFTDEELIAFSEIARYENEDYFLLGAEEIDPSKAPSKLRDREIIDIFQLSSVTGALEETRMLQRGKPYYIPPKKELLQYNETTYFQQTPEFERFKAFLCSKALLDQGMERIIFANILLKLRVMPVSIDEARSVLDQIGIRIQGLAEIKQFAIVYSELCNNSRLQCHRGHTPNEVAALCGAVPGSNSTLSMLEKKIGRNSPCPCGSGKKYKRCCGR